MFGICQIASISIHYINGYHEDDTTKIRFLKASNFLRDIVQKTVVNRRMPKSSHMSQILGEIVYVLLCFGVVLAVVKREGFVFATQDKNLEPLPPSRQYLDDQKKPAGTLQWRRSITWLYDQGI